MNAVKKTEHSPLGASVIERVQACPGSYWASMGLDSAPTIYSAEGTVAHALAAKELLGVIDIAQEVGSTYTQDGFTITVTQEMADAVAQYRDVIYADAGTNPIEVEVAFHLTQLDDRLWGTADCVAKVGKKLYVYDFKYGAGHPVPVVGNSQLSYYAVGASLNPKLKGCTEVELVVVQPRCAIEGETVRRWSFAGIELVDAAARIMDVVAAVDAHNPPLVTGEQCTWCPAAGVCPELREQSLVTAQDAFRDVPVEIYTPHQLGVLLDKLPLAESWIKRVREYAYNQAMAGNMPVGHKLVDKRATRHWKNETGIRDACIAQGIPVTEFMTAPVLKSPAQLEKIAGKAFVEPFCEKVSSGCVLVSESDKRPAVLPRSTPEADFSALIEE